MGGEVGIYWKLDDNRKPVPASSDDFVRWAEDFEARRVGKTMIGDVSVSTVFLCYDHGWGGGAPVLFETLVFGGPLDGEMERYCTWDEASAGHKLMVERVRKGTHVMPGIGL